METILLMLSGGLDSVYMLYYYLTETKHPLHVHHISLRYPQFQRWITEDPASKNVVAYCRQHYRDFEYSESRFDMPALNDVGMDSDLHLLVASKLIPNIAAEKVAFALGHNYDDDPVIAMPMRLDKVWWALLDRIQKKDIIKREILKPLIDLKLTKEDICRKMPEDLLRMCWSCRYPDFSNEPAVPCGGCHTCEKIEEIFNAMGRCADFPNLVRPQALGPCQDYIVIEDPSLVQSPPDTEQINIHPPPPATAIPLSPRVVPPQNRDPKESATVYSPKLKSQVALAALRNGQPIQRLAKQFNIEPHLIEKWKNRILQNAVTLFKQNTPPPGDLEARVDNIFQQVNELRQQVQGKHTSLPTVEESLPSNKQNG